MPTRPPSHTPSGAHTDRSYDAERRALVPTRRLYSTSRWRALRTAQLQAEPLCRRCWDLDHLAVPATVCDHVHPHRGDVTAFWAGPFQSLCQPCHDSAKQREETGG